MLSNGWRSFGWENSQRRTSSFSEQQRSSKTVFPLGSDFSLFRYNYFLDASCYAFFFFFLFQMSKLVETLSKQLETKGNEINKYRERHNLKIKGEESKDMEKSSKDVKTGGVLVAKES